MPEPVPISGEIARVVFELEISYESPGPTPKAQTLVAGDNVPLEGDPAVAHIIRTKVLDELRVAAGDNFRNALGNETTQVDVIVKVGSVEIVVIVTAVAMIIQNYNAIVGGIGEAVENTRRAFTNIVGGLRELAAWRGQMEVRTSWRTGPALATSRPQGASMNIAKEPRRGDTLTRDNFLLAAFAVQTGLLISLLILVLLRT